ncbi:Uncharacterised protein [Escherichia coli]|nr:Uncharacterised protein [Escherichia coli]
MAFTLVADIFAKVGRGDYVNGERQCCHHYL